MIFRDYPAWMIVVSNGLTLSVYALGAGIMARVGGPPLAIYLLFLLVLEVNLLAKSCTHCFYYGRRCFSGKGVICSWWFKRGDPAKVAAREVSWVWILPDLLVTLVPLGVGVALLMGAFDWYLLGLMVGLVSLAFPGNGLVRSKLACCHCHQRELGCPAEKLFRKRNASVGTA